LFENLVFDMELRALERVNMLNVLYVRRRLGRMMTL